MDRPLVIGVMGSGDRAGKRDLETAFALGSWIASRGWVLVSGGRGSGVMAMVNKGARESGGLTLGFLPGSDKTAASRDVLIPIPTDMGNARNNINVLASDIIVAIAFRIGPGTVSEIALAIKAGKPVLIISDDALTADFFSRLGPGLVRIAHTRNAFDQLSIMASELGNGQTAYSIRILPGGEA